MLFTEVPTALQLEKFKGIQAYGVAGKTRSLSPEEMEKELIPAFQQMKSAGARQVFYKVCSTFDSSPETGSIGRAMDCGARIFKNKRIPVLGGTPALGRYCLFGNLFARMGIGSSGKIYRLDRHPSMRHHPVTPAAESDLRLHLGKQTKKEFGLIDVLMLERPLEEWNRVLTDREEAVLMDALYETQLPKIGEWMGGLEKDIPQFSVGGSGIGAALGAYWNITGEIKRKSGWQKIRPVNKMLVISGSCSPVTAAQIACAKENGFGELILDAVQVCADGTVSVAAEKIAEELIHSNGKLIVHTGEKKGENLSSGILGTALGKLAKTAIEKTGIERLVIAGGDTSSYAARALEIEAVKMVAPLVSGAPLCKAFSENEYINGLEVNFKGGQVGDEKYFIKAVGELC